MATHLMKPLISVIMPAFNAEKFISCAIDSVISQTYTNWELLIVDDGSSDNTKTVISHYLREDKRIKYFYQFNQRQAIARNYAISKSKGTILAFLDSDDLWCSNKLEFCVDKLIKKEIDFIFTSYTQQSDSTKINIVVPNKNWELNNDIMEFTYQNPIPILSVVMWKNILTDQFSFDYEMVPAEDYDLWIRIFKSGVRIQSYNENLAIYRINNNSSTSTNRHVSDVVIKILFKNFTFEEYSNYSLKSNFKRWLNLWISSNLKKVDKPFLIIFLKKYKLETKGLLLVTFLWEILPIRIIKSLLYRSLN